MPRAQALRRLLWRVNGVLALGVLALVAPILLAPAPERPLPQFRFDWGEVGPREPEPCVDLAELKRECSRFWPVEPRPLPRPVVLRPPEVPTEPPLAAYEVLMWIRRPGQPDLIALSCKDPAHEARFFPMEGKPDKGVSLDGVCDPYYDRWSGVFVLVHELTHQAEGESEDRAVAAEDAVRSELGYEEEQDRGEYDNTGRPGHDRSGPGRNVAVGSPDG